MTKRMSIFGLTARLALVVVASACSDALTGPGGELALSRDISVTELTDLLAEPVRVDVVIAPGGLVAAELEVGIPGETLDEELVAAAVGGIETEAGEGTLTLDLADLAVSFDEETEFVGPDGGELTFEAFVAHVSEALAGGLPIAVTAERAPRDLPQDPDDALFHAARIGVAEHVDRHISIDVDGDNLDLTAAGTADAPDAILRVLGRGLELRVRQGRTRLGARDHDNEVAFEGRVRDVNVREGTFLIGDGVVIRLTDRTRMAFGDREIESLEPVAQALEEGREVFVHGEGVVQHADRRVIAARVLRFGAEQDRREVLFEGKVQRANAVEGVFVLRNETVVQVGDDTRMFIGDREIESLEPIVAALEEGLVVGAHGEAVVVNADRRIILAHVVRFVIREGDGGGEVVDFEGLVAAVDAVEGTFTLGDETVLHMADRSEVNPEGDYTTLAEVFDALEQEAAVVAFGTAVVATEGDREFLVVKRVTFQLRD